LGSCQQADKLLGNPKKKKKYRKCNQTHVKPRIGCCQGKGGILKGLSAILRQETVTHISLGLNEKKEFLALPSLTHDHPLSYCQS